MNEPQRDQIDPERLMTTSWVASQFSVTNETVRNWINQGKLKGKPFGRQWRIRYADFQEFVAKQYG